MELFELICSLQNMYEYVVNDDWDGIPEDEKIVNNHDCENVRKLLKMLRSIESISSETEEYYVD